MTTDPQPIALPAPSEPALEPARPHGWSRALPPPQILQRVGAGAALGVAYLLAEGVCQLALTPVLLRTYSRAEVGLWVLITNFLVLVQVGQAGLGPIATRSLAMALARGMRPWQEERAMVQRAYGLAAAVLGAVLIAIGAYIASVAHRTGLPSWGLFWWPFAAGLLLRMHAGQWLAALSSLGGVGYDRGLALGNTLLCYGGYLAVALCHGPISGIGIIYGAGGLVYTLAAWLALGRLSRTQAAPQRRLAAAAAASAAQEASTAAPMSLRGYARESAQFVVMNISGFVVLNLDVVLVERLFGAQVVASYGIIVKLGFLVMSLATLIPGLCYPFIARRWAERDFAGARHLYHQGLWAALTIALVAAAALLGAAPTVIRLWIGPAAYLGFAVLAAQMLFVLMSVHTVAQATPALATGQARFADLALLNAACAVTGSLALGWRLGPAGVALGNALGTLVPSLLHGVRARGVFSSISGSLSGPLCGPSRAKT